MNDTQGNEVASKDKTSNGKEQARECLIILGIIGCKNIAGIVGHFNITK